MKKWIASKLFGWAVRLDWDETLVSAKAVVLVDSLINKTFEQVRPAPKKKVGRPLGRKDSAPRKSSKAPA